MVMAIGDITAAALMSGRTIPAIVGDGSLQGTLGIKRTPETDMDNTMTALQEFRQRIDPEPCRPARCGHHRD